MRIFSLLLLVVAINGMPLCAMAGSSEYSISLGLGQEYNSNVSETQEPEADWISKGSAAGTFWYNSARFGVDGSVNGSYNVYALGTRGDEFRGSAHLGTKITVVENLFFVEARGNFEQVYQNLIQGETNPTDSGRGQVDQYRVSGSAYITPRISDRLTSRVGYDFSTYIYGGAPTGTGPNYYSSSSGTAYSGGVFDKASHTLSANLTYELTPTVQLMLDANSSLQNSTGGSLNRSYVSGGFVWNYSQDGSIHAKAGPRISIYNNGTTNVNTFLDAGWSQQFGRFNVGATVSSQYVDNPSSVYSSLQNSVGMSVGWSGERLRLSANASYGLTTGEDTANSNQLSLGVTANYALTSRLSLSLGASRDEALATRYSQVRWYANGGLSYDLGRNFSVDGYYRWKLSESGQGISRNYSVNVVGVNLRKSF
ncbi:MAG: hypothetical protein ACLGSA_02825 [Acidobacteriota bacterium]